MITSMMEMFEFAIDMEHGGDCQHINVHRCEREGNSLCTNAVSSFDLPGKGQDELDVV